MQKADAIRLKHMLDASGEIVTFVNGRSREDLDTNRMLVHSIVHCIEIIGEAASQVKDCHLKNVKSICRSQ